MINFDDTTGENIKEHNPNQPQISDHPCIILIIQGSESEKSNALLNFISHQTDIEKVYLFTKDPFKAMDPI